MELIGVLLDLSGCKLGSTVIMIIRVTAPWVGNRCGV